MDENRIIKVLEKVRDRLVRTSGDNDIVYRSMLAAAGLDMAYIYLCVAISAAYDLHKQLGKTSFSDIIDYMLNADEIEEFLDGDEAVEALEYLRTLVRLSEKLRGCLKYYYGRKGRYYRVSGDEFVMTGIGRAVLKMPLYGGKKKYSFEEMRNILKNYISRAVKHIRREHKAFLEIWLEKSRRKNQVF